MCEIGLHTGLIVVFFNGYGLMVVSPWINALKATEL